MYMTLCTLLANISLTYKLAVKWTINWNVLLREAAKDGGVYRSWAIVKSEGTLKSKRIVTSLMLWHLLFCEFSKHTCFILLLTFLISENTYECTAWLSSSI